MAKARIDSASLDRFRLSVNNMQNSISSINNSVADIYTQIAKVESDRKQAQQSLDALNSQKEIIQKEIETQQELVSQLSEQVTQIASELAITPPTIQVREKCGTDSEGEPIYRTKTVPNPAYISLQSQLASAQAALASAELKLSKLKGMLAQIKTQISNLNKVIEKCTSSITKLQKNREKLERSSARLQKATTLATEKIRQIERVVNKYNSIKIQQQPMVANRKSFLGVSLTLGRDVTLPKSDFKDAEHGAQKYLRSLGIDVKALERANTEEEKIKIISDAGVDKDDIGSILSISKKRFLPNTSGSFDTFSDRSKTTTGDSAEWYRFCVETGRGSHAKKEVYYDLTPYVGKKVDFLGYEIIMDKPVRKTDIVVNETVHQELKVGVAVGDKTTKDFFAELYADSLRLDDPNHANDTQEYRIYDSGTTQKSVFNDKVKRNGLLKMQERYPDRVSVYYNDVKLTLEELKKIVE